MRKIKPMFLSIKEIQKIMDSDEPMPTAMFSATKTDYIVKPRTILGDYKKGTKDFRSLNVLKCIFKALVTHN